MIATASGASDQTKQNVATTLSQLSDIGASFVLPRTNVSPAVGTTVAVPNRGGANASVVYPSKGSIYVTPGAKPDANEVAAGVGLAQQFGYEVKFLQTANDRGVTGVQTSDMFVTGLGRVDVYTPNPNTSPTNITKIIERKDRQASGVLVQADLSTENMASIAARTWGKPNVQRIQTVIFQKPDGTITVFKRPGG